MNDAKYIGLDVHQATISVAVLDSAGKLVMEAILETKAETILQFIHGLRGSLHVTFEKEPARRGCTSAMRSLVASSSGSNGRLEDEVPITIARLASAASEGGSREARTLTQ